MYKTKCFIVCPGYSQKLPNGFLQFKKHIIEQVIPKHSFMDTSWNIE